jgi:lipoate-protein ligase A
MAVDEALLEAAAADGHCTLRLYRWQEPTLSLGYFQAYADRWQHAASSQTAIVRRPSGGGAIMHDRELTYSLAIPSRHPLAVRRLECYRAVHLALVEVLAQWGIEATMATQSERLAAAREPFLCFHRR